MPRYRAVEYHFNQRFLSVLCGVVVGSAKDTRWLSLGILRVTSRRTSGDWCPPRCSTPRNGVGTCERPAGRSPCDARRCCVGRKRRQFLAIQRQSWAAGIGTIASTVSTAVASG